MDTNIEQPSYKEREIRQSARDTEGIRLYVQWESQKTDPPAYYLRP